MSFFRRPDRDNDAFYSARSLAIVQRIVEDPKRHLGDAAGAVLPSTAGAAG